MGPVIGGLCMSRSRDSIEGCPHYRGWLLVPVLLLYMSTVILCHFLRRKMRISFGTNQECYVWRTLLIGHSGFHSISTIVCSQLSFYCSADQLLPSPFLFPPLFISVSLAVFYHIKNRDRTREPRTLPIFDEKLHPLTVSN